MATANKQDDEKDISIAGAGDEKNGSQSHGIESEKTEEKTENHHGSQGFRLDLSDAFTPDPGTEDMFNVKDNKLAFTPGHLSKLLNPKSHNAFYALGGLSGLEKGLRTNRKTGLGVDEDVLDGTVSFEEAATKSVPKYGKAGDNPPQRDPKAKTDVRIPPPPSEYHHGFSDRKHAFRDNHLPDQKQKSFLELLWITYNDKILILLTIAAVVSLALGLYETFGKEHEPGEAKVEWLVNHLIP